MKTKKIQTYDKIKVNRNEMVITIKDLTKAT